jgi:hypothetical protein
MIIDGKEKDNQYAFGHIRDDLVSVIVKFFISCGIFAFFHRSLRSYTVQQPGGISYREVRDCITHVSCQLSRRIELYPICLHQAKMGPRSGITIASHEEGEISSEKSFCIHDSRRRHGEKDLSDASLVRTMLDRHWFNISEL